MPTITTSPPARGGVARRGAEQGPRFPGMRPPVARIGRHDGIRNLPRLCQRPSSYAVVTVLLIRATRRHCEAPHREIHHRETHHCEAHSALAPLFFTTSCH